MLTRYQDKGSSSKIKIKKKKKSYVKNSDNNEDEMYCIELIPWIIPKTHATTVITKNIQFRKSQKKQQYTNVTWKCIHTMNVW